MFCHKQAGWFGEVCGLPRPCPHSGNNSACAVTPPNRRGSAGHGVAPGKKQLLRECLPGTHSPHTQVTVLELGQPELKTVPSSCSPPASWQVAQRNGQLPRTRPCGEGGPFCPGEDSASIRGQRPRCQSWAGELAAWCAAVGAVGKGSRLAGETAKPPQRGSPSPAQPRGCPLPPPGFLKPRPGKVLLIRTGHGNLPLPQPHRDIPQHPPNLGCGPPGPSSFYPGGSKPHQALESGSNLLRHPRQVRDLRPEPRLRKHLLNANTDLKFSLIFKQKNKLEIQELPLFMQPHLSLLAYLSSLLNHLIQLV